jgi:hypothetical protein
MALALLQSTPMTFEVGPTIPAHGQVIIARGDIAINTSNDFSKFVEQHRISDASVFFDSSGGDLRGGIRLGAEIRKRGFDALLEYWHPRGHSNRGTCKSACAYAFLGGVQRIINTELGSISQVMDTRGQSDAREAIPQAQLGFHPFRTSVLSSKDLQAAGEPARIVDLANQSLSAEVASYLQNMGIHASLMTMANELGLQEASGADVVYPSLGQLIAMNILTASRFSDLRLEIEGSGLSMTSLNSSPFHGTTQVDLLCSRDPSEQKKLAIIISFGLEIRPREISGKRISLADLIREPEASPPGSGAKGRSGVTPEQVFSRFLFRLAFRSTAKVKVDDRFTSPQFEVFHFSRPDDKRETGSSLGPTHYILYPDSSTITQLESGKLLEIQLDQILFQQELLIPIDNFSPRARKILEENCVDTDWLGF